MLAKWMYSSPSLPNAGEDKRSLFLNCFWNLNYGKEEEERKGQEGNDTGGRPCEKVGEECL